MHRGVERKETVLCHSGIDIGCIYVGVYTKVWRSKGEGREKKQREYKSGVKKKSML